MIVRMLPADKAELRRLADEAGISLSAYCRVVLLWWPEMRKEGRGR